MNGKKKVPDWILSSKEERLLSEDERSLYFAKLREYCKKRKLTNTTWGATTLAPKLKRPTNYICRKVCNILAGGKCRTYCRWNRKCTRGTGYICKHASGVIR